jgi:hypothetical protein
MANEKLLKVASEYSCDLCHYKCCNKTNYNKHLYTRKHMNHINANNFTNSTNEKLLKVARVYTCESCNNEYQHHSSLCKHKKTCKSRDTIQMEIKPEISDDSSLKDIIIELIKSNSELHKQSNELQKQVIELCKNGTTNNTNCHNKFNINVFLNDKCKDAINLSDFIKNIEVSREDIQNTGRLGFVDGISKIIIDNLKQLDITERPIHCTDVKRETMYIKDEDQWNKEANDAKMRDVIQIVSRKSMKTLNEWKQVNPDYENGDSEFSQDCLSMQRNSVAGEDRDVYFPKVAKIVAKEVIVEK